MYTFKTTLKLSAFLVAGSLVAGAMGVAASGVAFAQAFDSNGRCWGQGCEQIPPDTGHWGGDRNYYDDQSRLVPDTGNSLDESPLTPPYGENPWREENPNDFNQGMYEPEPPGGWGY